MEHFGTIADWILGIVLVFASLGVLVAKKPVHACLFFLLTLFMLATIYLKLEASFIAIMQILVYAGAILVLFMYVMILFQNAHEQMYKVKAKSAPFFIALAAISFLFGCMILVRLWIDMNPTTNPVPTGYGSVQNLGKALYLDYFFPFEAIILLFLVAFVGSLYIAKKVHNL